MSIKIIIFSKLLNYPIIINYNVNLFNIYIKLCSATKLSYELFIVYKSTQNGSVPLVWPAKDLNKNFYQFPFSHPKQTMLNKGCKRKFAEQFWEASACHHVDEDLCTLQRSVSISDGEDTRRHLLRILWKSHALKITAKSRCHLYNVPVCVRRDAGWASRGPGEQLRGAVARLPIRDSHPRHTVDRPGEAAVHR